MGRVVMQTSIVYTRHGNGIAHVLANCSL